MSTPVLRTESLHKSYGAIQALASVDLEVHPGEVFGLLGPNGAGKTTTVKVLITLLRPDSGSASVLGHDVVREPERVRAAIGYVPQELTGDRYLSAREHLEYFCDLYHLTAAERRSRTRELLALVGLEEAADRPIRTFSGGMKKKLDLACGLVHRPRVLFLDEPSLGLDVQVRRTVWDEILALRAQGTTVFLCTNDMAEADRLCDRVAIVDRGRIAAQGTPEALRTGLGGDVVSLELADPARLEQAEKVVAGQSFVRSTWSADGRIHATVQANETALPALLGALREAALEVTQASYHRPGLEEVFLRHTGHRFEDARGTAGPPRRTRG